MRGVLAAVFSGVAFFLVMNTLWGRPPATGRNYVVQFAAWVVAWAPGLLALTLDRRGRPRHGGAESAAPCMTTRKKIGIEARQLTGAGR